MFLDNPCLKPSITESDLPGIIKAIMKEKHWKQFEVASAKLILVPHWFFNFDVYYESGGEVQTYSSQMAMDATTGALQPIIIEILKDIPVEKTKEIKNGEVEPATIKAEEAREVSKIKIAGELKIPKDKITTYGFQLIYVPVYRCWVTLGRRIQRVDIDAISGSPLNIQEVPEKERGIIEITADTLEALKTPEGWIDYSKRASEWIIEIAKGTGGAVAGQFRTGGILNWLFFTRAGQYTLLTLVALVLFYLVLKKYGLIT